MCTWTLAFLYVRWYLWFLHFQGATFLLSQLFPNFLCMRSRWAFRHPAYLATLTGSRVCDLSQISLRALPPNLLVGPECGLYLSFAFVSKLGSITEKSFLCHISFIRIFFFPQRPQYCHLGARKIWELCLCMFEPHPLTKRLYPLTQLPREAGISKSCQGRQIFAYLHPPRV